MIYTRKFDKVASGDGFKKLSTNEKG